MAAQPDPQAWYRIWVSHYRHWQPQAWNDIPPEVVALEPAEAACFTPDEALAYLEGYNSAILETPRPLWAVAVPVVLTISGDLEPGQVYRPRNAPPPNAPGTACLRGERRSRRAGPPEAAAA